MTPAHRLGTMPPVDIDILRILSASARRLRRGGQACGRRRNVLLQQSAPLNTKTPAPRFIDNGRIAGYYSLCNAQVELHSASARDWHRAPIGTLPASLVTWLAKEHRADFDGRPPS